MLLEVNLLYILHQHHSYAISAYFTIDGERFGEVETVEDQDGIEKKRILVQITDTTHIFRRSCLTVFRNRKFWIAHTLARLVQSVPLPVMCSKYRASFRHIHLLCRIFKVHTARLKQSTLLRSSNCWSKVSVITNKSSKYTKTWWCIWVRMTFTINLCMV